MFKRLGGHRPLKPLPDSPENMPLEYRVYEAFTSGAIYFGVVFSPWAFGTTQDWAIWIMNGVGYLLGLLLLGKCWVRRQMDYRPLRWGDDLQPGPGGVANAPGQGDSNERRWRFTRGAVKVMGWLTVGLLAYVLLSALNARAVYNAVAEELEYQDYIPWLPHTYDSHVTWFMFWRYLGLACAFWAVRDWLLTVTPRDRLELSALGADDAALMPGGGAGPRRRPRWRADLSLRLPTRLRHLLWLICFNGGLVAAEGIVQRQAECDKLLFLVRPRLTSLDAQFGPFAYRGNGSQFVNLIWPVAAALVWLLARHASQARELGVRIFGGGYVWLGFATMLMAAAPVVSSCRGGSIIALGLGAGMLLLLLRSRSGGGWRAKAGTVLLFCLAFQLAVILGWSRLSERMEGAFEGVHGRTQIHEKAWRLFGDHRLFGSGAGTMGVLYKYYVADPEEHVEWYAHNDWLETLATFG